jgi:hypothetical protein
VGTLSQFSSDPCPTHWQALKRVLRYLQATPNHGLKFTREEGSRICGYTDADWAGDIESRRSTSGYVFMRNGGCIRWESQKQRSVALSSTEAEYMALSEATKGAVWLKVFLGELGEMASDEAIENESMKTTKDQSVSPRTRSSIREQSTSTYATILCVRRWNRAKSCWSIARIKICWRT